MDLITDLNELYRVFINSLRLASIITFDTNPEKLSIFRRK